MLSAPGEAGPRVRSRKSGVTLNAGRVMLAGGLQETVSRTSEFREKVSRNSQQRERESLTHGRPSASNLNATDSREGRNSGTGL